MAAYCVTLKFGDDRAVTGEWTNGKTADMKFDSWIWLYGRDGVTITLTTRTGEGPPTTLKCWPDPTA